jgi:hypothetical protein
MRREISSALCTEKHPNKEVLTELRIVEIWLMIKTSFTIKKQGEWIMLVVLGALVANGLITTLKFIAAIFIFGVSATYAIYEGIEKIRHPHEITNLNAS